TCSVKITAATCIRWSRHDGPVTGMRRPRTEIDRPAGSPTSPPDGAVTSPTAVDTSTPPRRKRLDPRLRSPGSGGGNHDTTSIYQQHTAARRGVARRPGVKALHWRGIAGAAAVAVVAVALATAPDPTGGPDDAP